jgi:EmrB/QacA subfamily drug resistance transporter
MVDLEEGVTLSGAAASLRRTPALGAVLAVSALCAAMAFIDSTVVNIAFPSIEHSFPGNSVAAVSWVLDAYNIVFAAFLVAAGRIADVFGRRRLLTAGVGVFVLASAMCSLATSLPELIAFRTVQALGAAMLAPTALAVVLDAFPAERRAHAVTAFVAVSALAAGIGPAVGGALISLSDWRLVFLLNVPVGLVALVLVRTVILESRAPGRRRLPDLLGSLVFAGAVAALVAAIVDGRSWGWLSVRTLAAVALAGVLFWFATRRARSHPVPMFDLTLMRRRSVSVGGAATALAAAGYYGYTLVNVLFLTGVWHYSILDAGLGITPGPFVAVAVARPAGRAAERFGARLVLLLGGLFWAAGVAWFVTETGLRAQYLTHWLPGMVLAGIGAGIFFPTGSSVAVSEADEQGYATASGLNTVARQAGGALGVAVAAAIIGVPSPGALAGAFHNAWSFDVLALATAGLVGLAVGRMAAPASAGEPQVASPSAPPARASSSQTQAAPALAIRRLAANPAQPQTVTEFLGGVPMFARLEAGSLERLAAAASTVRLEAGDWLLREGEPGDALYVVTAGRLEVLAEGSRQPPIALVGRGGVVGEYALVTAEPRSASVRATRATDLIAIGRADFERVLHEDATIAHTLMRQFAGALRARRFADTRPRALPATVVLLALDEQIPLAELSDGLLAAIGAHARGAILQPPKASGQPAPDQAPTVYGPVLDAAVSANDLVLLPVAYRREGEPWSRFCLQQADRILAIGSGLSPAPDAAPAGLAGCDLVAWDAQPGSGRMAAWARALDPLETHAWRPGPELQRDLARSARRLTGNSVGIVLGGGGARALAHLGVIEELTGAGVVIDRVGAVSFGSFVGGLLAAGRTAAEIDAVCFEELVRRRPLGDYTLPRHALLRGHRGEAMIRRTFGSLAIEELPLSFFCLTANLRTGERVVHRSGSLYEAVAASVSVPVLLPPRRLHGSLQVDGALIDNLPVGPMAALAEGPIIAVDIKAGGSESPAGPGRRRERLPPITETLMRVMFYGSKLTGSEEHEAADLLIRPRNNGVGFLEFHQIDRAREAGRLAARQALDQLADGVLL